MVAHSQTHHIQTLTDNKTGSHGMASSTFHSTPLDLLTVTAPVKPTLVLDDPAINSHPLQSSRNQSLLAQY